MPAVVLFLVLVITILLIRIYKQWKGLVLGYGQSVFVLAMLMILSSAGWYLPVSRVTRGEGAPTTAEAPGRGARGGVEVAALAGDASRGQALYQQYCAICHGAAGKGDGPAAGNLPVKPRNHTDGAYMNALTDAHLRKVIAQGGAAVGKSGLMPGWGGVLTAAEVEDVITHLRTLAVPPYRGR